MGYPETAIDAFVTKQKVSAGEIPEEPNNVMDFFKLSPEHWREEREVQIRWSRAIERFAPDLYLELKQARENKKNHSPL